MSSCHPEVCRYTDRQVRHVFLTKLILVLLLYDYILTTRDEIRHIWKNRLTGATVFYILIRYSALLDAVMTLITEVRISTINLTDKVSVLADST